VSAKLGAKVRGIRRREGLTQVQLAERLGISPSYLNLIEHNRRPLPAPLLIKLAQLFQLDLQAFAAEDDQELTSSLLEAFGDPVFEPYELTSQEVQELVTQTPNVARAVLALYGAFRRSHLLDTDQPIDEEGAPPSPSEEVSDLIQRHGNFFPELEDGAEALWRTARLQTKNMQHDLVEYLRAVHGFDVQIVPEQELSNRVRRIDRANQKIYLSEVLAPRSINFQLAHVVGLFEQSEALDRLCGDQLLTSDESRRLGRVALANYFAGAVLMPYDAFFSASEELRCDVELLGHRFRTSFEQVCHRLTTLRRPGKEGVPLHLLRVDIAGNVSKRFSASGFRFARFGGSCPRWNEHAAFLTPGMIRTQISQMPDGSYYFSVARVLRTSRGGFKGSHALYAIGIGCELQHAGRLVYADGVDLDELELAVPIGTSCPSCPRSTCDQRAFPASFKPMRIDEDVRGTSFYVVDTDGNG
jgi:hypothetical protein